MIRESDWQRVSRDVIAAGRDGVEPPTFEQVEALHRGVLPEDEADRVREALAYYPDLAAAMSESFPESGEAALSADQVASDVAKIRERVSPNVVPFPIWRRRGASIAAALAMALALGAVVLVTRERPARATTAKVLIADGDRSGGTRGAQTPIELEASTDYLLKPLFQPERSYRQYRVELLDVAASRSLWTREVDRQGDGSFPVPLSTGDLTPGRYQLVLYGDDERLATYTVRVYAP